MASPFGGIDPDTLAQIQQLMQSMAPSAEDKAAARQHALLAAGLGIMQNANLNPIRAAGMGGLLGASSYNDELKQLAAQKGANMGQAVQAANLANSIRMQNFQMALNQKILDELAGGGQPNAAPPTQPQPYAPSMGANFGMQPSTQSSLAGVFNDPSGALPNINTAPAPLPTPAAPPVQQQGPTQRDRLANVALMQGVMKGDITPALNFKYRPPLSLRANAGYIDSNDVLHPGAAAPPGYVFNPQTQQLEPIAGGQEAIARAAVTSEAAKLSMQGQKTIDARGRPGIAPGVSELDALFAAGTPLPYGAPSPYTGTTAAAQAAGQIPPPGVKFADWQKAKAAAAGDPTAVAVPDNGTLADAVPLNGAPAIQPRSFTPTALSPGESSYQEAGAKQLIEREQAINEAGRQGAFASARWAEMQKLGQNFNSNVLTPQRAAIASYFNAFGASPDTVKAVAGGSLPAMEGFGKLAFESTLNQIKAFSARPAAAEVVLGLQNNPNIGMTVPGRNLLMQVNKNLADYNVQMMKAMQAYKQANGTTDGFEAAYYDKNPPESVLPTQQEIDKAANGPLIQGASSQQSNRVIKYDAQGRRVQ